MTIDWWTLGLQTINVLVLVWILARFLFRPVTQMITERQAAAHAALDDARAAKAEAEAARAAAKDAAAGVANDRTALLAKARADAEQEKQRLHDEAMTELDTLRADARTEMAQAAKDRQQALSEQAGALALDIAARLIDRLPDEARIAGFIDGLADAVAKLPEATRAAIGDGAPVDLRAARALTDAEKTRLTDRLQAVLGRPVDITVTPDPSLLAGLELDAATAIVRNTLRADLDRIEAEVTRHDG
ncbi:F0F1 ATP synthase subunit delta [Nioella nitratireducens]|uniref:F0F1 ATP synthase subunit delta n=1 Tax=Nioella nitratireducens TaxID=1287720 RepID=UPI0008FD8619|nr:F0F1 ATP synthase subunit delta [Nioella nitratireducens]